MMIISFTYCGHYHSLLYIPAEKHRNLGEISPRWRRNFAEITPRSRCFSVPFFSLLHAEVAEISAQRLFVNRDFLLSAGGSLLRNLPRTTKISVKFRRDGAEMAPKFCRDGAEISMFLGAIFFSASFTYCGHCYSLLHIIEDECEMDRYLICGHCRHTWDNGMI